MSLLHRTRSTDDLPELTPAQLAELDALDAALAGDDIVDAALADLVRDVRSVAPQLRPEATQQLNERVAAGFATPAAPAAHPRRRPLLARYPGQRAGLAATVLIAAVVGVAGGSALLNGDDADTGISDVAAPATVSSEGPQPASAPDATPADQAASAGASAGVEFRNDFERSASKQADSNAYVAPSASSSEAAALLMGPADRLQSSTATDGADRSNGRAVERAVDLSVRVKSGELSSAAGDVTRITRTANGYVATSQLSLARGGAGTASFELRVDSKRLDRAIDQLAALGTVTSQNESSRDITSALDSAQERLADATKERRALLAALAKADAAGEIASLRARIAENRRLRASLDADVQRVQRRADLTTIALSLTAPSKDDPAADDGDWSLGDAAHDAWGALRAILGGLLVAAAVAAPFTLIAGAGWLVTRRRRRAARERALDA